MLVLYSFCTKSKIQGTSFDLAHKKITAQIYDFARKMLHRNIIALTVYALLPDFTCEANKFTR